MKFFAGLCLFLVSCSYAQQVLFEHPIDLTPAIGGEWETYTIQNKGNKHTALFFINRTTIKWYLLDSEYRLLISEEVARPLGKFDEVLGFNIHGGVYQVIYGDRKLDEVRIANFNPKDSSCVFEMSPINIGNRKVIKGFTHENKFYILSVQEKASTFCLSSMNDEGHWMHREINYPGVKFTYTKDNVLYSVFPKAGVEVIDLRIPNSLSRLCAQTKLYIQNNHLYLTLDHSVKSTTVLGLSLVDTSSFLKKVPKIKMPYHAEVLKSNSVLEGNLLYQITASIDTMWITITDIQTLAVKQREFLEAAHDSRLSVQWSLHSALGVGPDSVNTNVYLRTISRCDLVGISIYSRAGKSSIVIGGFFKNKSEPLSYKVISAAVAKPNYIAPGRIRRFPAIRESDGAERYYSFIEVDTEQGTLTPSKEEFSRNVFGKVIPYINEQKGFTYAHHACPISDGIAYGYYSQKRNQYTLLKFVE